MTKFEIALLLAYAPLVAGYAWSYVALMRAHKVITETLRHPVYSGSTTQLMVVLDVAEETLKDCRGDSAMGPFERGAKIDQALRLIALEKAKR